MRRAELYRVRKPPGNDPKRFRIFVVVSRQVLIDSRFSTVICAPVYSAYDRLSTQVPVSMEEGLKHESSIHCDELVSLPKLMLKQFIGILPPQKVQMLDKALLISLQLSCD